MKSAALKYQSHAVQTANGPHLLLMLCDRWVIDLARAEVAINDRNYKASDENLQHAQKILRLLRTTLDPGGFTGAAELVAVYGYLERQLIQANLKKDLSLLRECSTLFGEIHQAWRAAVNIYEGSSVFANVE